MFLNKYKFQKQIGKGSFGVVYLIQDQDGSKFALKQITTTSFQDDPSLRDYLYQEIECMKSMNSQYILKIYDVHQDISIVQLILEYCNGGDLISYQNKLPGKVFSLQKATEILSDVIKGLEQLHKAGYLHRDIKPQNILIHKQNGKEIFKLADFGFSRKNNDICRTILGTQQFMSPEIYRGGGNSYGFQVDMWAFGVLFYFMLNMEYPFNINSRYTTEKKQAELRKVAQKFSYSSFVKRGMKKIVSNCTQQVEDLFSKIFDLNPETRITFSDIRQHPVFSKYFPVVSQASKIFYSNKFQSKSLKSQTQTQFKMVAKRTRSLEEENAAEIVFIEKQKSKKFPKEKQIIERKKEQIKFLGDNAQEFLQLNQELKIYQKYMLGFNIQKKFIAQLNKQSLNSCYPDHHWDQYTKTSQFQEFKSDAEADLFHSQLKFMNIYDQTEFYLKEISQINPIFSSAFNRQIEEKEFQLQFKKSYRKSTIYIFEVLRQSLKKKTKKGNKLNYILSLLLISNAFNKIFSDLQNLQVFFKKYFLDKNRQFEKIDYCELREWLSKSSQGILNNIVINIYQTYFKK